MVTQEEIRANVEAVERWLLNNTGAELPIINIITRLRHQLLQRLLKVQLIAYLNTHADP